MTVAARVPIDTSITIADLARNPYPTYRRLRATAPVLKVEGLGGRILLTRAADTRRVKEDATLFSSDDPATPMKRAFLAHTLMRKDGAEHTRERTAMAPAFAPKAIRENWEPLYTRLAHDYVGALPRGETVELFSALAGPFAARCLAHLLGLPEATDEEMQRWSQALIDGAGNYAWADEPFARSDRANAEMDAAIARMIPHHRAGPNPSALAAMVNAPDPLPPAQIRSNIKIAIGGGINEPRDALLTVLYGLLANPEQYAACKAGALWGDAFDEAVRWVAPIQVSGRIATRDTEIGGVLIEKGAAVMTAQASSNRDEAIWGDDAEEFNLFRARHPHQAFGNGPHFCQGKHIARRMIADILLPVLVDRFPAMTLPDLDAVVWHGFAFRGPVKLPVRLA
jgi:cytochrome P450